MLIARVFDYLVNLIRHHNFQITKKEFPLNEL